jgi:hypothetical protein
MCVCDEWRINQTRCVYNPNSGLTVTAAASRRTHFGRAAESIAASRRGLQRGEMHYADYHHCYEAAGPLYVRIEIRVCAMQIECFPNQSTSQVG